MVDEVFEGDAPEVEEVPLAEGEAPEPAAEEAEAPAEAPPNEPDEPAEDLLVAEEDLPEEEDLPGVVTQLTPDKFLQLKRAWITAGKPRRLNAFGVKWTVVDDGAKFIDTGVPGGMGDYGSLSTSRMR